MALPKWLKAVETFAPLVLSLTPLAPIAAPLTLGFQLAEQIPGATGAQKKAIVQQIAAVAAQAANAQANKTVIDPASLSAVSGQVIDSVVGVVNLAHVLPEAPAPQLP